MHTGVLHGIEVATTALLYPEQSGYAGMLGAAAALAGILEAQQLRQGVFGLFTGYPLCPLDFEFTARLAQERLAQDVVAAAAVKLQLDAWPRASQAIRSEAGYLRRFVALEKGCAQGSGYRALAGFVGPGKEIQSRRKIGNFDLVGIPTKFAQPYRVQLHA